MIFFGKQIFFVKNSFQQESSSVLVRKKNRKPKLSNPKPFCVILKTFVFSGYFYQKKMMFLQENHHFPNTSIFRPLFSINLVLICSRALCSTAAIWYTKGLQKSLPGIKNPHRLLMAATSQPFFFSLHLGTEARDVESSSENFPRQKIVMGRKVSEKNTMYKNNLSKDES